MKDAVTWLSLFATVLTLVTPGNGSAINDDAPTLSKAIGERAESLPVTRTVGVTLWLGDGASCTPEAVSDITDTITEYSTTTVEGTASAAIPPTVTETTTQTAIGCPRATRLGKQKAVITVTEVSTITSCSCTGSSSSTLPPSTVQPTVTPSSTVTPTPSSTAVPTATSSVSLTDTVITPPLSTPTPSTVVTTTSLSVSESVTTVPPSTTAVPPPIQSPSPVAPNSVCPSLISNPYYTPIAALPVDYTWGCPAGYICQPAHIGDRAECTIEAGLPDVGYVCTPSDCVPAPELDSDPASEYDLSKEYFNLNPEGFGLDYSIYDNQGDTGVNKRFISLRDFITSQKAKRVDTTNIPTVCYNDCNGAAHEPQVLGKTSEICKSDSAFMENVAICEECVTNNAEDGESGSDIYSSQMQPTFAQWLNFCSDIVTSTTTTSATSTASPTTSATTETTNSQPTSTSTTSLTTQTTEETTRSTQTEKTSSAVETTETPVLTTTSASGSIITTSEPGTMLTTSSPGSVVTTEISGSTVTTSVPGTILTTSVPGSVITTSVPGSIVTIPHGPSGSSRGSPAGSASPSSSSPIYNGATAKHVPSIGFLSLVWAVVAPLI